MNREELEFWLKKQETGLSLKEHHIILVLVLQALLELHGRE